MRYAIVTPSFGPDFERCKLLAESIDRYVGGDVTHHVLVDRRDMGMFGALKAARRVITPVESVLPWWLRRVPGARRWWLSLKTPPVRNWILQQLVKLSVAEHLDADAYVFVDSDVVFFRPFETSSLVDGEGRLRLFSVPGAARLPSHFPWHQTAARLLGLPPTDYFGSTYIGNLITWRRENLCKMYRHIESVSGRPWLETVARQWHLSEYILYGVFVEHVLAGDSGQYPTDVPLCHISWDYRMETDEDLEKFFAEIWPEHVALMLSSKQGLGVERYRRLLDRVAVEV